MRIVEITQYFPPENAYIPEGVAVGLARRGHQVRVITGFPNYPAGELFPGYQQRWRQHEHHDGVDVLRVPLFIDHSQSPLRRMVNYLSFGLSSAFAGRFGRGQHVTYVYATQMTAAFGPWLRRGFGGAPYVLHIQDLWPDSITGSSLVSGGRAGLIGRLLEPWLASVYRRASAVIAIAPTMAQTLCDRGVPDEKLTVVYNWAAEGIAPAPEAPGREPSETVVLYAGNVGDMQDLGTAVRAVHAAADSGVRLVIVGDGVTLPALRDLVAELGCTNVDFVDRVPVTEIPRFYAACDFALVSLKNLPVFAGTIPSKFQAALAQGVPVISTVPGDVRALTTELQVGLVADPEDVPSLTDALRRAAAMSVAERTELRRNARRAYEQTFSMDAALDAISEVLSAVARPSRKI